MVSDILHTQPINPLVAGSGSGTGASQAMADGVIDGKAAGVPVAMGGGMMGGSMMQTDSGRTGLATAMTDFMNSSLNKSGVASTNMTTLMQQLRTSGGQR